MATKVRLKEGCTSIKGVFYVAGDEFEVTNKVLNGPLKDLLEEVKEEEHQDPPNNEEEGEGSGENSEVEEEEGSNINDEMTD